MGKQWSGELREGRQELAVGPMFERLLFWPLPVTVNVAMTLPQACREIPAHSLGQLGPWVIKNFEISLARTDEGI